MAKVLSKSSPKFIDGGSGSIKQNGAGPAKAGSTSSEGSYTKDFGAKGGSGNHMLPFSGSGVVSPGETVNTKGGNTTFGVKGGSGKMFGYSGSMPAQPGRTSR